MTEDQIIELAIQGHASTRDAIRWAMQQEREVLAKHFDKQPSREMFGNTVAEEIRAKAKK